MRAAIALLLLTLPLWAENFRLYLKDGSHHIVREYRVQEDRVRYYSVERSDWEELPLDMVDLKKTEAERKTHIEEEKKSAAMNDAEDKFEREMAREAASIPESPGIYFVEAGKVVEVKRAEVRSVSDKKRTILKVLTPLPVVPGKLSIEVAGEHAAVAVPDEKPNFYFRMEVNQRYAIARLKPAKGGARQVAVWTVEPITKLVSFDMDLTDIFRQQIDGNLFKFWPVKPLAPGEYAVVQYVEGDGEIQVWDFRVVGGTASPAR